MVVGSLLLVWGLAGGASAALSDAPLEHASWATQQTGPGAEEATALADIVGIDVQNLQRNLALWQCHGTKQLFTLGDKEHSLQCPTGPSNLTVTEINAGVSYTAYIHMCTGNHEIEVSPLSRAHAPAFGRGGPLPSFKVHAHCDGTGGTGRSAVHKPGMTPAAAEGWLYALYGQLGFFDGYSADAQLARSDVGGMKAEVMIADVICASEADTTTVYETAEDGFALTVKLRCSDGALQLAARKSVHLAAHESAAAAFEGASHVRAALGGEAKAAALSRRAALARRAAKALHPRPMETVPLASDNVKCSMPLTLASAVDPTVQEPKIKFTSECSCNGDEVDCQSLKPCKGKGSWAYTNHVEDEKQNACMDLVLQCHGTTVFGAFGCDGKLAYETAGHAKAKSDDSSIATGRLVKECHGQTSVRRVHLSGISGLEVIHQGASAFELTVVTGAT